MTAPETELFVRAYKEILALGFDVYPFLPDEQASYPFIHVGSTMIFDEDVLKGKYTGRVIQNIGIWHNDLNSIGTVSDMAYSVRNVLKSISKTENFQWNLTPFGLSGTRDIDRTSGLPLEHYEITAEYRFI